MSVDSDRLTRYVKDTGLSFKQNSKSYIFTCPLCGGKEKLYIRKADGRFACWKCRETRGFQGAPEYAFSELLGQPVSIVKKSLYGAGVTPLGFFDVKLRDFFGDTDDLDEEAGVRMLTPVNFPYHCIELDFPGAKRGVEYLQSRNIPVDIAKHYGLRYSPEKHAVVFPVIVNGDLVGWQYRTIENTQELIENVVFDRVKTWSSKNIPRDDTWMFLDGVKDHVVICEGPVDAIRAHLVGGGVAAMGKVITQFQINRVLMSGISKAYIALDPDAFAELDPLIDKFGDSVELLKVEIPDNGSGKPDLGALSYEDAKGAILSAKPLLKKRVYVWLKPLPHVTQSDILEK